MADDASAAAAENIAVCIRVRPMNEREKRSSDASALCCVPSLHVVSLTDPETGAPLSGKGNVFQYDEIFDPSSDTHAMYERVGRRIVHSTLRGINGTIFAYGQTSSGKTYTMQGDGGMPFDPEAETSRSGLLQLAVDDIFQFIEACDDRDFLLRVSFVEIYNEVVKDLLTLTEKGANLKLREDPKKGVYVECQEKIITNYEDIVTLLQTGNRNRTVGHTAMNDKSSRSHSVFRIVIESKQKDVSRRLSEEDVDGAVLVASLNLVDLAGSESLRHTGAEGIRQREAGNINKSLLTLARVINALASSGGGGQNAPFRDSKLTRLLQNSLGGNTRTLIICCVTPSDRYIEETKSTLQFAARAKDIQTTATVNEVLDDQTQLRRLKREVHELRTLVNSEALTALKAENEALISEKNCNKSEMARLMGLILSSTSVAKANAVSKERKRRGKRSRETWGPGDFPADIKALRALSPHPYPRKRHSLAKENVDPQTLFCVNRDDDNILATKKKSKLPLATRQLKQGWTKLDNDRKSVFDLFAAVYSSYNDGKCDDPIAAGETNVDVRRVSLDDSQRACAFDVLARMVDDVQSKGAVDGKLLLRQDVEDRCLDTDNHCSESSLKVNALVEEMKAKLEVTQESLAKEKKRCHDLEAEKASSQQMAEEELSALRYQLETLKLKSSELQHQLGRENHQLVATISSLGHDNSMSPHSSGDAQENVLDDAEASRTFLQLAAVEGGRDIDYCKLHDHEADPTEVATQVESIAEEEELVLQENVCRLDNGEQKTVLQTQSPPKSETISRQDAVATDRFETSAVEKLAGELQSIMQELAQLQSDHEQTALEKEELQAETERMSEEIEAAQRHVCEMSEALMEKDHIAKVLQAQLDAKLMTISQMQTKYSDEVGILQQSIQDLMTEKDQLLTKTRESDAERNVASDDIYPKKPAANCSDSTCTHSCTKDEALHLPSEVGRLTEHLVTDKSELFDTNQCLQATLQTCDAASCHPKQENDPHSTVLANEHEQIVDVPLRDIGSLDQSDLRYNKLKEDFVRVTEVLDNVSRERDDCVEELRALESQLMEVSEEKMKFAVAANEQEIKLRKVQQDVLSSTTTIATLRAQLDDAESAKVALEARKTELEQSIEKLQASWKILQVDHAAMVEQMQERETTVSTPENEGSTAEVEHLQQRLEIESKERKKLQLDVTSYEETLPVGEDEVAGNGPRCSCSFPREEG
uniref:Kinesin motor domain-containing protein n=1 Tax=Hyaloperonospora arabidopsidis (strain Emoy2) TaxID=559515 RepID=M4C5Y8_HYAAE